MLHAWAIHLGLIAAGLPVAIHFLTRPKPIRRPWSTLKFVRELVQQRRARHWLRDVVILSLRTLAVLLIAAAMARPIFGPRAQAAVDDSSTVVRVVVLDVSQSMETASGGTTAFERARSIAARRLEYQSGVKANLIQAAARPRSVFPAPSSNFGALQDALSSARVRPERLQVAPSLSAAAEMLSGPAASGIRRELVVISDFQRTNWAAADFSIFPADTKIELESLSTGALPANLAVLGVTALGSNGQEAELAVDVGNYSSTPREVRVETRLADAVVTLKGTCPPLARTRLTAPVRVPAAGWHLGTARLVDVNDALAADNSRPCAIEVRPPPSLRLLTRQSADQKPSASYFLERGLVPEPARDKAEPRLLRLDPLNLDRERLSAADIIAVDHPGRMSNETIQLLTGLVRRGRGLLYVACEPADAVNIQQLVAAAGTDLKLPVAFAPPAGGVVLRNRTLTQIGATRAPFAVFGDQSSAGWARLRFDGGLVSKPSSVGIAEDIRASLSDQTAFLVSSPLGAGRLAVLNADLMSCDLPRSPVFVPMLSELVAELAMARGSSTDVPSGEPATVSLHLADDSLEGLSLDAPKTEGASGQLLSEAGGLAWHADAAPAPAAIPLRRGGRVVSAVVTGLPAEESDLRPLSAEVLKTRLSGGRNIVVHERAGESADPRDTLWTWLATVCALCVTGEALALWLFRT